MLGLGQRGVFSGAPHKAAKLGGVGCLSRADHHRRLADAAAGLGDLGYLWVWCELGRSLIVVWHRAGAVWHQAGQTGVMAELGWSVLTV